MKILSGFLANGLIAWFGLLVIVVAVRILRGDIGAAGFLSGRLQAGEAPVEPERVAAMVAFPMVLGMYAFTALHADMSVIGPTGRPVMPDVPEFLLTLLMGGNGLYLAGKLVRR